MARDNDMQDDEYGGTATAGANGDDLDEGLEADLDADGQGGAMSGMRDQGTSMREARDQGNSMRGAGDQGGSRKTSGGRKSASSGRSGRGSAKSAGGRARGPDRVNPPLRGAVERRLQEVLRRLA